MFRPAGRAGVAGASLGLLLILLPGIVLLAAPAAGQTTTEGTFITGPAARAWEKFLAGMQAILDRQPEKSEAAFAELLDLEPSPLRIALLADFLVNRTSAGGALLLFEQDREAKALGPEAQEVAGLLEIGREQMHEADDGFYFCQLGRFDVADANFKALLAARPDPVALLEFTDREPRRREILIQLQTNPVVGESIRAILKLLDLGEYAIKADPTRIRENIERLAGPPRGFENAVDALKDSGEYAIPFLVQYLRDPNFRSLTPAILRALPLIDRPALNPLVMAIRVNDEAVKRDLIEALGKLGYAQAVPYLLQLQEDPASSAEVRAAALAALENLRARGVEIAPGLKAAEAFGLLAEDYYDAKPSLMADPRLDMANVWYWRDDLLVNIPVPTPIFNEVMALRCSEEALRLAPDMKPALALWLAANFRRQAQLPEGATDATRPENNPPGSFFAQSAGAEYCLMGLARAVDDGDPAVALGMIEALRRTAGPASLVTDREGRLPLAEALSFPDRMVRIRAGLTLGAARPTREFRNYQNLMPVLTEALMLHAGVRSVLVVDPDTESANSLAGMLRPLGFDVVVDSSLPAGLEKIRTTVPGLDLIVLASDVKEPALPAALAALRSEFRFAATPVVLVTKPGDSSAVRDLVRGDHRLTMVSERPTPELLEREVRAVSKAVGATAITPELGAELAQEAAEILRALELTNNPLFRATDAETALLATLSTKNEELRLTVADVLGHLASPRAQQAIAAIALDAAEPEMMRVRMFAALAAAAKQHGNLLTAEQVQQVVTIAAGDENMTIREAASQALGALNVAGTPASEIIRNQYRG